MNDDISEPEFDIQPDSGKIFLNYHTRAWGVREHCYKKKAATVGQNGRLSALCNFFNF